MIHRHVGATATALVATTLLATGLGSVISTHAEVRQFAPVTSITSQPKPLAADEFVEQVKYAEQVNYAEQVKYLGKGGHRGPVMPAWCPVHVARPHVVTIKATHEPARTKRTTPDRLD